MYVGSVGHADSVRTQRVSFHCLTPSFCPTGFARVELSTCISYFKHQYVPYVCRYVHDTFASTYVHNFEKISQSEADI